MADEGIDPPPSGVPLQGSSDSGERAPRVKRKKKKTERLLESGRNLLSSGSQRLKDSSRFLVDGVRAALTAPVPLRDQVLDGWRAGHCELDKVPLKLDGLINRSLSACTAALAEHGVDALRKGESVELPLIPLDGDRIEAVIQTLILTAMEACTSNMRVEVSVRMETGGVIVQVSSPRMLELSTEEEETLDVVGEIVRAHGGEFDHERGQGSSFLLGLPIG